MSITFTEGNLLDAKAEALVNTVNTVGVMGKGIALMFKEAFPENFRAYVDACKKGKVQIGQVFATERRDWIGGPRWIVNFPTKKDWRHPSKLEWIEEGLKDLRRFIVEYEIRSIALPPLGSGNGKLNWFDVRPLIEEVLDSLPGVDVTVYEPTGRYQNVAKRDGVQKLTAARALTAELIRRYGVLGFECTILEVHKLVYLLQRQLIQLELENPLKLEFKAGKFGPYAPALRHQLNDLDGSYLHCEKRVADAGHLDLIWFEDAKRDKIEVFLSSEAKRYQPALEATTRLIDGFESPVGMELLGTIDWLLDHDQVAPTAQAVKVGLQQWLGGGQPAERKLKLFDDRLIKLGLARLAQNEASLG
ncbi:MAG: macro domain-containing protein [Parvibaculaceae bacterium]